MSKSTICLQLCLTLTVSGHSSNTANDSEAPDGGAPPLLLPPAPPELTLPTALAEDTGAPCVGPFPVVLDAEDGVPLGTPLP